ncbi:Gfo/Idh/MocA family oxidoreductase [bacterium]|nr:Gfo/Idh/MocA family oxidoreductase [candidate division CSSED10-310 bacterium]
MGKNANIAVIGAGYWGKNLIRNYAGLDALKIICDKNEIVIENFKKQYPNTEICFAVNNVLSRNDIQGVVIATPAETHFSIAREALLSDKHIYVEKPLVLHENEATELIQIAEERNRIIMVGHLMQYHPVFMRLKSLVENGELGRINYIYSHRLNLGKIRREENALWSFAPHDISMILALAGDMPESVQCTGGNYLHKKIADVTTTHMEFPSGLRAHIFVSWLHPFKEQKMVLVGDRKMAVFDDTKPWKEKLLLYQHEIKWQTNIPVPSKADAEKTDDIPEREPLRLECETFLDCITNGTRPVTDGNEGLRVLKILNASQRSLNHEGIKIQVNESGLSLDTTPQKPEMTSKQMYDSRNVFIHPSAVVDDEVSIGAHTKIWHFSHILSGSKIGENCNIGQNVVIGPDVSVGNKCKIQNNVSLYKGVTLEDEVFCGPSMVFTNVFNPRAAIRRMDEIKHTLVKKGATIGANATIICGVTIGQCAFVGAGAVVTKDIKDHALVTGNPARQVAWMCECGNKLDNKNTCKVCGKQYPKLKKMTLAKGHQSSYRQKPVSRRDLT